MKQVLFFLVFFSACILLSNSGILADQECITLFVGGKPANLKPSPVVREGVVYAPVALLDLLGAKAKISTASDKHVQVIEVTTANGCKFTQAVQIVHGELMLPVQEIADRIGAVVNWDKVAGTVNLLAKVAKVEFDGCLLKVTTSYPVSFDAFENSKWKPANKIVLDLYGVYLPADTPMLNIDNKTSIPIRTGSRDDGQTARIVIDMPDPVKYKVVSSSSTTEIALAVSGNTKVGLSNLHLENSQQLVQQLVNIQNVGYYAQSPTEVDVYIIVSGKPLYTTSFSRGSRTLFLNISNAVLAKEVAEIRINNPLLQRIFVSQSNQNVVLKLELTRVVSYEVRWDQASSRLVVSLRLPKGADGRLAGKTVVLDPGHGGADGKPPGCFGLLEKNVVLDIAREARKVLAEAGLRVVMTRDADVNIGLSERALIAKRCSADFFISIHCNAAETRTGTANGTETFFHGGDASGQALAECIHSEVVKATGLRDRSIKPDTSIWQTGFGVLRMASSYGIPAVLIEVGFLDNPMDAERIADPAIQRAIAKAILGGLKAYVEGDSASPFPSQQLPRDEDSTAVEKVSDVQPNKDITCPQPKSSVESQSSKDFSSGPPRPGRRH
jgi:N-acetylmuramoyl-L-alanine amidase